MLCCLMYVPFLVVHLRSSKHLQRTPAIPAESLAFENFSNELVRRLIFEALLYKVGTSKKPVATSGIRSISVLPVQPVFCKSHIFKELTHKKRTFQITVQKQMEYVHNKQNDLCLFSVLSINLIPCIICSAVSIYSFFFLQF